QNSAKAKRLGGRSTARKSPIGSTNNRWGMKNSPLIKVSLYMELSLCISLYKNLRFYLLFHHCIHSYIS
ncbi:hypothetical protein COE90_24535, partial [Bacillus pseudomycoides]